MRLFEPYSKTSVGCIETFVAAASFIEGAKIGDRILGSIGLTFAKLFVPAQENNIPEMLVSASTLLYSAHDALILKYVRSNGTGFNCQLAHVHHLMKLGEHGPCHTNGKSNFAYSYVPIDHAMWALHWFVNDVNEWVIGAADVPHPDIEWQSGSRLFTSHANPIFNEAGRPNIRREP